MEQNTGRVNQDTLMRATKYLASKANSLRKTSRRFIKANLPVINSENNIVLRSYDDILSPSLLSISYIYVQHNNALIDLNPKELMQGGYTMEWKHVFPKEDRKHIVDISQLYLKNN